MALGTPAGPGRRAGTPRPLLAAGMAAVLVTGVAAAVQLVTGEGAWDRLFAVVLLLLAGLSAWTVAGRGQRPAVWSDVFLCLAPGLIMLADVAQRRWPGAVAPGLLAVLALLSAVTLCVLLVRSGLQGGARKGPRG